MEEQGSPLGWASYYQDEGAVEELKHSLLYSALELEVAVVSAHEEISRKDDEILQLRALVETVVKQRDEFEAKCAQLVFEKNLLSQRLSIGPQSSKQHSECPSSSNTVSNQEDDTNAELLSASDGDDSNNNIIAVSSSCPKTLSSPTLEPSGGHPTIDVLDNIPIKRPLPENGKFLQAIMEAGPLLQTLLLAGPLPRWQHPPPQLNSGDIPPVKIFSPATKILLQDSCLSSPTTSGGLTNKRPVMMSRAFSPNSKHQKVSSPTIIEPPH